MSVLIQASASLILDTKKKNLHVVWVGPRANLNAVAKWETRNLPKIEPGPLVQCFSTFVRPRPGKYFFL